MSAPGPRPPWTAQVLTLFPPMFPGPLGHSLAGKALARSLWVLEVVDIRDSARDKHRTADDAPFGGGPGMVLRPDVLADAIDRTVAMGGAELPLLCLSPRGRAIDQAFVAELARGPGARLLCGRFEGVDQRVLEAREVEEVSIGDFVLSGGEPAALALIDAVVRLLPGVIGEPAGLEDESFAHGLLEYPHYTRPQEWEGHRVPEVLVSGHHAKIEAWRLAKAEEVTKARRPDLWDRYVAGRKMTRVKR